MSLQSKLREAELDTNAKITLTYSTGGDVIHARDGYVDDVLEQTDFATTVAGVITTAGFDNQAIDDLRGQSMLEDYERDFSGFDYFVAGVIAENIYELDFIDQTVEQYDYKRGFLTLEASVQTTVGDVMTADETLFTGWQTTVPTKIGNLTIDG